MADVTIYYRDGAKEFRKDNGAPGGSYEQSVMADGEFLVITDAYGEQSFIPKDRIKEVKFHNRRRY